MPTVAGPRYSAVSPAATSGRAESRIAPRPSAISVTPSLSAPTAASAANTPGAEELAATIRRLWPEHQAGTPYVVCTGGEPALQLDTALIDALHKEGFEIAIETNGTRPLPPGIDWICVSPKADTELVVVAGNELKLVYPQPKAAPERFAALAFEHFYLQPMDGLLQNEYTRRCIQYCLDHPQWKLSLQTHKLIGID